MSFNAYTLKSMKKYRFISPMRQRELEAEAAIHRKKWKAKMFLHSGSYFDDMNPQAGHYINSPKIKMPSSKEDIRSSACWIFLELNKLPENVQIYFTGLYLAIENDCYDPWELIVSKYFYTQHEWDMFRILILLKETCGIYGISDGPFPLYWFESRDLLLETLHLYPSLMEWRGRRSLPIRTWDQKDFVKEVVAVNYELFESAPKHIKESRDKVLEAAKVDGRIIRFIRTRLRNDPEVAMTAINSYADAKDYLFKKTKTELGLI